MPNEEKKVYFGLSNVHYAKLHEVADEHGNIITTYDTPKKWPGAVSIALDPQGAPVVFSADNGAYYTLLNNRGYEGDYECARIPDDVRVDTLGSKIDDKGFIVETDKDEVDYFALMFEFESDTTATRYIFYKVSISNRPSVGSQTVDVSGDASVLTEKVKFRAVPQASKYTIDGKTCHLVKSFSGKDVDPTAYNNFYQAVHIPSFDGESS